MAATLIDADLMRRFEQLHMLSRKMAASRIKGERRSRRRGSGNDFADYRNYVSGDDLRFLDWKVYARLERLFLKLFLEEENLNVHILVDVSRSMDYGEPNKLHYAKQAAAALGYITMCGMDNLTVRAFGDKLLGTFGPKRGKANAPACFDFLNALEVAEETSLERTLRSFSVGTRGKGLVVLISDFYDKDGYEQALRYLFGRQFEVFVIHLLSPEELAPELQGDVRLVDCEMADSTDVSMGRGVLELYKRSLDSFCGGLRRFILARGGIYLLTSTALPFDKLVLDLLARRGLVR